VVTLVAGVGAGTLLAPRIPTPGARAAVLVISFAGAVTAIVKGVGGLV
jgi:hypothetical protein